MASVSLSLPSEFGWVVFVCLASVVLLQYLGFKVGAARRKFGVKYPAMYSDKEPVFNCVQRAHQNTLEVYTMFLMLLIFGGLQHPCLSACAGALWLVSRVVYAHGYYTGEPANRNRGAFGYLGLITLLGTTTSFALHLLKWI